jgi:hypothetical protein
MNAELFRLFDLSLFAPLVPLRLPQFLNGEDFHTFTKSVEAWE